MMQNSQLKKELVTIENAIITPITYNPDSNSYTGGVYDKEGNLVLAAERCHLMSTINLFNPPTIIPAYTCEEELNGSAIYLGHYTGRYGGFLLETLARFWPLEKENPYQHFLFHPLPGNDQIESDFSPARTVFDCFDLNRDDIQLIQKSIRVERLTIPTKLFAINDSVHADQRSVYQKIATDCKIKFQHLRQSPKKIYLSRKKLDGFRYFARFAVNEAVVEQIFAEQGFAIIYPEELEFAEQVCLISQADVIAGISGAALHSAVFMRTGQTVLTIGTPVEPNAPSVNQLLCADLAQVQQVFIPFKGGMINELHGTFAYHIPHIHRKLNGASKKTKKEPSNGDAVVAIVGLHDMRTTRVARAFHDAGLFVGDISRIRMPQMVEHWIHEPLARLNDAVLHANNASWKNPPQTSIGWDEDLSYARSCQITDMSRQVKSWMFKDSRTLYTLPFWQEGIKNFYLIGVFCHPMSVAISLFQSEQVPIPKGFYLGCHYNQLLLKTYLEAPFPLICADLPTKAFLQQIKEALEYLNKLSTGRFQLSAGKGTAFFAEDDKSAWNFSAAKAESHFQKIDGKLIIFAQTVYSDLLKSANINAEQIPPAISIEVNQSVDAFRQGVLRYPENVDLYIMLGDAYALADLPLSAADSFQRAIEIEPDNLPLQLKLVENLEKADENKRAAAVYEKLIASEHVSIPLIIKLILLYRKLGKHDRVIKLCQLALNINPYGTDIRLNQAPYIYTLLAHSHKELKDFEAAKAAYKEADSLSPNQLFAKRDLGTLHRQLGEYSAAIEVYQKLIARHTKDIWDYIHLADSFNEIGKFDESRAVLQKAADVNSKHADIYRIWGNSFQMEDDDPKAIDQYRKALSYNPNDVGTMINLGWALIRQKQNREALKIMLQANKHQPDNPHIQRALQRLEKADK